MSTSDDLDNLLNEHRGIRQRMPSCWNAFFARFGTLRPIQLLAIPPILDGKSVLVTAPTAGGKTEAVIAPVCERMCRGRWPGLSVLVVTPTRALVNDLYTRLANPCSQVGIQLGRKTADHPLAGEGSDRILITTPESTESLLSFRREWLSSIQVIVLDEIHLLDGSPRGDQLRQLLSRLSAYRHHIGGAGFAGLQRIAMSATVSDPRGLADLYLGQGAEVVTLPGQRQLEARTVLGGNTSEERAEAALSSAEEFEDVRKILVFVNSRKQVDACAGLFRSGRFAKAPVYGHHGSLSKSQREQVESRFQADSAAICVATMTLEVGIDIGDIDLVVCMDPPFSLASFLQRIGRGCRRLKGATRVVCVARDRAGELIFQALIRQARLGIPQGPVPPFRRSVLLQQILAYLQQVPKHRRITSQFARVFASTNRPVVGEHTVQEVVEDLVETGLLDRQGDVLQPATAGWGFIQSNRIYSNIQPSPLEIALVDVDSGKVVATVATINSPSGGVCVAGQSYHLVPGGSPSHQRVRGGGSHLSSPRYHARSLPYAFDVGASLAGLFGIESNTLAILQVGDNLVIMTWLGRLLNAVLAAGMKHNGFDVVDGSFHLTVKGLAGTSPLDVLRESVQHVLDHNPLPTIGPERMVDIGPHFKHLSASQQARACEDWLDVEFLERWICGVSEVRRVAVDSDLGADLLALV